MDNNLCSVSKNSNTHINKYASRIMKSNKKGDALQHPRHNRTEKLSTTKLNTILA